MNNGCASISYNSSNVMRQSYSLWFGSVQDGGQRSCDQGIYKNYYFGYNTGFCAMSITKITIFG